MTKYATLVEDVVDVISFDPEREWVPPVYGPKDPETGEVEVIEDGYYGDVLEPWVEVPDTVFPGFTRNQDGTFTPPPPPPPPSVWTISKSTPWLRMTDDEAELITGAMQQAGARLRGIYDAAVYLSSDDKLWPQLREIIAATLGSSERADELLAPETIGS